MSVKKYPYYPVAKPTDLKDLVNFCAKEFKDKKAFWYKTRKSEVVISFEQLKKDIDALGTYLYSIGLRDTHVALIGENSYEWIVSYFAIVNGGNVVVPLDKELNVDEVEHLLHRSDATAIIHSDTYSEVAEIEGVRAINMDDFSDFYEEGRKIIEGGNTEYIDHKVDVMKTCAIVFTSGTTSEPKGVMLCHNSLIKDAISSSSNLFVPEGTVCVLPLYHTFGFMAGVACQMIRGYPVFINTSLRNVLADIKYAQPRHIAVVPMLLGVIYNKIWDAIREGGKEKLVKTMIKVSNGLLKVGIDVRRKLFGQIYEAFGGKLEMIISGGSAIEERYVKGFKEIGINVINGYGITECSPIVATTRNEHYCPASVGSIQPGIEGRIVDGEIQIKGEVVFKGYYKDPDATAAAFDGEWFKTGDLGAIDEDNLLYITGRLKNLIILSNGKNVAPEELESKILATIKEVKEVVVYEEDDRIAAEIYADPDVENAKETISEQILQLNREWPAFKKIASVKYRDEEFPKTTTKKIKRNYSEAKK